MKVAKDYSNVPTVYYKPETPECLECGTGLKRSHRIWSKYIIQLTGTIHAVSMGYRCANDNCSLDVVYKSAEAESLSLKYYSFGMDVIAKIGEMRFSGNQTLGEIHSELAESISRRSSTKYREKGDEGIEGDGEVLFDSRFYPLVSFYPHISFIPL